VAVDGAYVVNHLPVLWVEDRLIGHVALNNDLHRIADGADAVFIFRAEDSYISPNWYPTKAETHRHVPTWNYSAVNLHGRLVFDPSRKAKLAVVGQLTKHFEGALNGDEAWKMRDAPRDYMDGMLDNIVAFSVAVGRVEAKSKLSQNREPRDYEAVRDQMRAQGKQDLAHRMADRS
jgi:transcriptional regulator